MRKELFALPVIVLALAAGIEGDDAWRTPSERRLSSRRRAFDQPVVGDWKVARPMKTTATKHELSGNADTARAFGRDLSRALHVHLQTAAGK